MDKREDQVKLNFLQKGMGLDYRHHWILGNFF